MRFRNKIAALGLVTLTLAACGGGGGDSGSVDPGAGIQPPVTVPGISTQAVFTNLSFTQSVALLQAPDDSTRWFVVEKRGSVRVFNNDQNTSSSSVFFDISDTVDATGEGGLLGFAFDPDYPIVPEVYVSYTRSGSPLVSYVSRFTSVDGGLTVNAMTEEPILTVLQDAANHNGGDIAFGPDDYLYVAFGDGGGSGDPNENAQNTSNLKGTIIRLDIDGAAPFEVPEGNPFAANDVCTQGVGAAPCPEIFAWGLRNPWRFNFDDVSGKLWAGDVGQGDWEEIDLITVGGNYGWNDREGPSCFDPPDGCATGFEEPITSYDHTEGDRSVTGGFVYRGSAIADLVGWYVFGDFISGRLFGIPENSQNGVEPEVFLETSLQISSFGQDTEGELYVLGFGGSIHQIIGEP
jgi:glucose/arabinose dehydrogenase